MLMKHRTREIRGERNIKALKFTFSLKYTLLLCSILFYMT